MEGAGCFVAGFQILGHSQTPDRGAGKASSKP